MLDNYQRACSLLAQVTKYLLKGLYNPKVNYKLQTSDPLLFLEETAKALVRYFVSDNLTMGVNNS